MIFHLPRVLSPEQVSALRAQLNPSTFVDGMQTGGDYVRNIKSNREARIDTEAVRRLDATVQTALAANNDFQIVALPLRVAPFIFSSYTPGLFYGDHTDNAVMGRSTGEPLRADLSMTIFLSDPAEYDGGELVIDTDLTPAAYKLQAGDAVVYPCYSLHRVEPVTRGERLAAVGWIQSQIRFPQQRQTLIDLAHVLSWMLTAMPDGRAHEHPEFRRLEKVRANLTRMWSET
ncbi:MAG TPA: Fe2+-dependent dioxygenase [Alphaproteobacteria bacterium]